MEIVAAYRKNDLFNKYLPPILGDIKEVRVFEATTTSKDIRSVLQPLIEAKQGPFVYISDHTCSLGRLGLETWWFPGIRELSLDEVFTEVIYDSFRMKEFQEILKEILPLVNPSPEKIIIVEKRIADHNPGRCLNSKMHAKFFRHDSEDAERGYAEYLKGCITGIVSGASIVQIELLKEAMRVANKNDLLVVDRHALFEETGSADIDDWQASERPTLLCLPLETSLMHISQLQRHPFEFEFHPEKLAQQFNKKMQNLV